MHSLQQRPKLKQSELKPEPNIPLCWLQEKAYVADVDAFLHIWLQESAQVRYTPHLLAWTDGGVRVPPGILFPAWPVSLDCGGRSRSKVADLAAACGRRDPKTAGCTSCFMTSALLASCQLGTRQVLLCDSTNEGGEPLSPAAPQFPLQNAANAAWIARLRGSRRGANRKYSCWAESQVPPTVTATYARVSDADASHMEGSLVVSIRPNMMPTHVLVCMLFRVDCHISAACHCLFLARWHSRAGAATACAGSHTSLRPLFPCLQLRYMLGMRNRDHSYVVGTGKGPRRPQDRAASCPLDFDVECNRSARLRMPYAKQLQQTVAEGHSWQLPQCFEAAFWQRSHRRPWRRPKYCGLRSKYTHCVVTLCR
jgi:hypothetical protein